MSDSVQRLKEQLPHILANLPQVSLVYLFGSQVKGRRGPMSDYDLALLVDHGANEPEIQARMAHELRSMLKTERVDVVLLHGAPIELAYAIIAEGELLHQRDVATRVEYEAQVMSRYGDYLPVLRRQREEILREDAHAYRVQRYRAALGRTERTLGEIRAAQSKDTD